MYVCRKFERITGGLFGAGWDMTPMPILLALPSNPIAIIVDMCAVRLSVRTHSRFTDGGV